MSKVSIPGHENNFLIAEFERGCEVNRVVAAKIEIFGVLTGTTSEIRIDADRDQIVLQLLERRQGFCVLVLRKSALAPRGR